MTAIVIPAADIAPGSDKLLEAVLDSIKMQNYDDWTTIVAFDGCRIEFVEHFKNKYPFIDAVVNIGNRSNFAGNANRGLRRAHQHYGIDAVVVNQDCILPKSQTFCAIVGEGVSVPTQVSDLGDPPVTQEMLDTLNSKAQTAARSAQTKLTGFCMHLSKPLMDKIGYFDERFKSTHEDDDMCARALLAGFPVEYVDISVHHYVSKCGSYDDRQLGKAHMMFRQKWSVPNDVEHIHINEWIRENHRWIEEMRVD